MNNLQPLCPAIVFSKIYNYPEQMGFSVINHIKQEIISDNSISTFDKTKVQRLLQDITGYTIIGMEYADNYKIAYDVSRNKKNLINKVCYLLIELAIKTGYSHADFHLSNIMTNENDTTYFKGNPGSVLLIDFGLAVKISPQKMKVIREEYKNENYNKIIQIICEEVPSRIGIKLKSEDVYDVICKFDVENDDIKELINAKKMATDEIIENFNSRPKLPLTNSIKNKMYPGIISEETDIIEIKKINIDNILKSVKTRGNLKILFDWIAKVLYKYFPDNNPIVKTINSIFYTSYIIENYPKYQEFKKLQLASLNALFIEGLDDVYFGDNWVESFIKDLCSTYDENEIETSCIHMRNELKNVKFITALDYMTQSEIDSLNNKLFKCEDYDILNVNNLFFENPKKWVETIFRKTELKTELETEQIDTNLEINFNELLPFKDIETIEGGYKNKKIKKSLKLVNHNYRNKSKNRINKKYINRKEYGQL
jgi:hypothetical protein